MKKYTVIYSDCFSIGSHTNSIIKYVRIETSDLEKIINTDNRFENGNNVWFIFQGWPALEDE